jgi:hypothetical protein
MKLEIMEHLMAEGMAQFVAYIHETVPVPVLTNISNASHFTAVDSQGFVVCRIDTVPAGLHYRYQNNNHSEDRSKRYARIRRKIKRKRHEVKRTT